MNNVIGFKGTEMERWFQWNSMRTYRGCYNLFCNDLGEWEQRVARRDYEMYKTHLQHYIQPAA